MSKVSDKDKKTPKKPSDITTMAVNILVSERIEAYCKAHGMLKKDFIPKAVEFIENFNVDLTAETLYLEEKKAEKEAKEVEKADIQALPALREKFDSIMNLQFDNGTLTERTKTLQADNQRLADEVTLLRGQLGKMHEKDKLLAMALTELQHCKGLFSSANTQVLKELGIE